MFIIFNFAVKCEIFTFVTPSAPKMKSLPSHSHHHCAGKRQTRQFGIENAEYPTLFLKKVNFQGKCTLFP